MDIKNILYDILFDKIFIGFILGILAAFFYDFLKNQFYLRRKKGFPVFYLHKCSGKNIIRWLEVDYDNPSNDIK